MQHCTGEYSLASHAALSSKYRGTNVGPSTAVACPVLDQCQYRAHSDSCSQHIGRARLLATAAASAPRPTCVPAQHASAAWQQLTTHCKAPSWACVHRQLSAAQLRYREAANTTSRLMSLEASSILSNSAVSPMTLAALRKSRVISSRREMHLQGLAQQTSCGCTGWRDRDCDGTSVYHECVGRV